MGSFRCATPPTPTQGAALRARGRARFVDLRIHRTRECRPWRTGLVDRLSAEAAIFAVSEATTTACVFGASLPARAYATASSRDMPDLSVQTAAKRSRPLEARHPEASAISPPSCPRHERVRPMQR
jgi:hypothetical protein